MKSSPKIILSDEFGDGVTYISASQDYTDVMSVHTATWCCNYVGYDCSSSSISLNQWFRGVLQLEICEDFQDFIHNSFAKSLAKLVFQLGHFAPISFAQIAFIAPSWKLRSGNEASGGSHFFVKVWSENEFDHFLIGRPHRDLHVLHVHHLFLDQI